MTTITAKITFILLNFFSLLLDKTPATDVIFPTDQLLYLYQSSIDCYQFRFAQIIIELAEIMTKYYYDIIHRTQ